MIHKSLVATKILAMLPMAADEELRSLQETLGATITDQVTASDLLAAGKLGAISLTLATLEAATPELRHFFQDTLNECPAGHDACYRLAQKRGWYGAHATLGEQLLLDLKLSEPAAQAAEKGKAVE